MIRYISSPEHIISLSSRTFDEAVDEVLYALLPTTRPSARWSLCKAIREREELRPTVLPNAVAFPRAETDYVRTIVCGVGIAEDFAIKENPSEAAIHTMFVTLYPIGAFDRFVPVLANLVHFSQDPEKMSALKRLAGHKEEFEIVRDEVFPLGVRGFIHSQLLAPVHRMHNRM